MTVVEDWESEAVECLRVGQLHEPMDGTPTECVECGTKHPRKAHRTRSGPACGCEECEGSWARLVELLEAFEERE